MPSTQAYRVQLDAYAGPLDLLLYLVKRHEIDLNDIPIARLTEQYLEHLNLIENLDIERAGEFLVMAATLLEVKSQMLLPPAEAADDDPDATADPRFELVQQLLAYKRYKDAAFDLEDRKAQWELRYAAHPKRVGSDTDADTGNDSDADTDAEAQQIEIDLEDVHVLDLCQAFARILDSVGQNRDLQVTYDDTPLALYAEDVYDRLQREGPLTLQQIFLGRASRSAMIGLFLATLELVRDRRVRVVQNKQCGEIRLEIHDQTQADRDLDDAQTPTDWRDPDTGQIAYDWPDPQAKERSEKRAKIRAQRLARLRTGQADSNAPLDEEDDLITLDDNALNEEDIRKTLAEHHHEDNDNEINEIDAVDEIDEVDETTGENESQLSANDDLIPDDDPN
jgi:segregation and condensation protein A